MVIISHLHPERFILYSNVFSLLPQGVNSIYLEIYDECSFTMDELIAWGQITIPTNVLQGETHEDWYPLNGKQGDGVEGMINLVLSYTVCFLGFKFSYFFFCLSDFFNFF